MKKIFVLILLAMTALSSQAAPQKIKLDAPNTSREATLMKSLQDRHSTRSYADREISMADLSDLLWAANGINRPASGGRTAASAMNKQDIDVYVVMKEATYVYNAKEHSLDLVAEGDFRGLVAGGQDFVNSAPVCLVLVSESARFNRPDDSAVKTISACDAGIVSANISLFCSGANLATVPRMSMNAAGMKEAWSLTPTQIPIMNHPVGYYK